MKIHNKSVFIRLFFLSVFALPVYADFGVVGDTQSSGLYGNAETECFNRAINGAGSTLSPAEQADLADKLPPREDQRYYGRLRVSFSTLALDQIKNRAQGTDALGAVNINRTVSNQVGLEVALGYVWSPNVRGDLEYLANKNLHYNANPALIGVTPARQLSAQIKSNTILANAYYDFTGIYRFTPYLTGGVGLAVNSVQASLVSSDTGLLQSKNTRSLRMAWQLGLGLKFSIFQHWFLDASYRYIRLGNNVNVKPSNTFKFLGTYTQNATSIGLIYLF